MQGLRHYPNDVVHLDMAPLPPPPTTTTTTSSGSGGRGSGGGGGNSLSIDEAESTEARIQRLISEHPVIIFSRSSCCMCHVMKKLLATIGVHPTVIELEDHEIACLPTAVTEVEGTAPARSAAPAAFIGGVCVGGLESLVALHLSGHLVPKLVEVGALWV